MSAEPPLSLQGALVAVEKALAAPAGVVWLHGGAGALGPAVAAHLAGRRRLAGPVLYVVADEDRAAAAASDLEFFCSTGAPRDDPAAPAAVLALPAPDSSPYADMQPNRATTLERMAVLFRLARGPAPLVLVASAAALARRVLPPDEFARLCFSIEARTTISRQDLLARLVAAGYSRAPVVEDAGTFAARGAVIDVFPSVYRHPVRIELDGDQVESLRLYDGQTQRTLRTVESIAIHPVRETVRTKGAAPRARILAAADAAAVPSSQTRVLLEQIESGEEFFGIEALAPAFHATMASLFQYLPPGAPVVVEDPEAVIEETGRQFSRLHASALRRRDEHRLALDAEEFCLDADQARTLLQARIRVELRPIEIEPVRHADQEEGAAPTAVRVRIHTEANTSLRAELQQARGERGATADLAQPLRDRIAGWLAAGQRVRLVAPNRTHGERLSGLLKAWDLAPVLRPPTRDRPMDLAQLLSPLADPDPLAVLVGPLGQGFRSPADGLVLVAEEEIFGPRAHREARVVRAQPLGSLGEIGEGDLAVHDVHGVGRYRGLKKLPFRGITQDFLHLEFDGGAVYVPVYRIGLVQRYVGGSGDAVRLDKLGGKTWLDKRRRVSADARKVAEELLQLYAQRRALPGHAFPAPDVMFSEFEETFPFEETPDQAKAIAAVLADMQTALPMDRLVCGDVGYGKTEVALRAALLAVLGGRQVAVLAPTTVLTEQHFLTFSERFRDFPVTVASLSRFRARNEQKDIVAKLAEGKIDVVVGTHRLLSRDVRFHNLGLVVIDEEQRFGVTHKERLKELRSQIDVLTLTATPIPRTLQMAMTGLREISIIATPPADRLAIRTFVCRWDEDLLREALHKELGRGGQVFFVHNRVEDLPEWVAKIATLAPGARVTVAHGQMAEGELEQAMVDFVDGKSDILCCTTIIESGLDIPRANTMIVNRADRFGLAQLYQIRGRIGRARDRAYCYLVVPPEKQLSADAKQRLAVLQRFTELGAGFQVATHDLEIRGAGELLGEKQSGALAAVGFDTYARILEEAVAELRGQPIKREQDPEFAVDVPAFLPDDYIPDTGQRLDFYRRLAQAEDEDGVREVVAELGDRYGDPPEEAKLLAEVMVDRTLVRKIGARGYELSAARLVLNLGDQSRLAAAKVAKLLQPHAAGQASRWKATADMRLVYSFDERERRSHLAAARLRLHEVLACLE